MIVNPHEHVRVRMELTSTLLKHFDSKLPQPSITGTAQHEMSFVGRGSGRIVSEEIAPTVIDGIPYIMLDMGRDAEFIPHSPSGLMSIYGKGINPDGRRLTVFGRDISIVSSENYENREPPSELKRFPQDLANVDLEFSGLYEDGYLSEESIYVLQAHDTATRFRISGLVPQVEGKPFETTMEVRIDSKIVAKQDLAIGEFSLEVPISPTSGNGIRKIEVRYSGAQRLPGRDGRSVAAKLSFLGFI